MRLVWPCGLKLQQLFCLVSPISIVVINLLEGMDELYKVLGNFQVLVSYYFGSWQGKGLLCLQKV